MSWMVTTVGSTFTKGAVPTPWCTTARCRRRAMTASQVCSAAIRKGRRLDLQGASITSATVSMSGCAARKPCIATTTRSWPHAPMARTRLVRSASEPPTSPGSRKSRFTPMRMANEDTSPVRIAYDAAPLLNPRTGVGHYAAALLEALLAADPELGVSLFAVGRQPAPATTPGSSGALRGAWGDGRATLRRLPVPARLVVVAWELARHPGGEVLFGRTGAVHGTNFWVPPLSRPNGVVTLHDLTFLLYPELCTPQVRRYRWIVPQVLKRCAVVLTPSETVAEQVSSELSFPRDRIVVTPEGVRHSALSPPSARREGRSYLLFTGAREPRKNLD